MNEIIQGDCLEKLKVIPDNSVDMVCTDPPYGYSFMGKDWDKAVPSVEVWQECLRADQTVCGGTTNYSWFEGRTAGQRLPKESEYNRMKTLLGLDGRFDTFIGEAEREVIGKHPTIKGSGSVFNTKFKGDGPVVTAPSTDQAKALDGSYGGFQPKPAVEIIIVAMKPLSEKTYVDQALKNGKGITWLDSVRIPTEDRNAGWNGLGNPENRQVFGVYDGADGVQREVQGRFPANLLVSDDVLNDGVEHKSGSVDGLYGHSEGFASGRIYQKIKANAGSYSRYFDLDKWAETLPFLVVPKASKSEKNKGLAGFEEKKSSWKEDTRLNKHAERQLTKNNHPTVKPLKLMSYLITLGSRKGDIVLDPFVGSGTTCVADKELERQYIGIEQEPEYVEIANARLEAVISQPTLL